LAEQTINAGIQYESGSPEFTKNIFTKFGLEIVQWNALPDAYEAYWFVQANQTGTIWNWTNNLENWMVEDGHTKNTYHYGMFSGMFGARDWRGWTGATGA
jgi:hypothetical protein